MMSSARHFMEGLAKAIPQIQKPIRKLSLTERLAWTALALIIYVVMSTTFLYGIPIDVLQQGAGQLYFLNVVFAQNIGTLTTLGIGPIVTAGLVLQLLVGSQIIKLDLSKHEDRALFTSLSKLLAVVMAVFQAFAYSVSGFLPGVTTANIAALIFTQLVFATIVIIMLDELVQKWGLGSGVSLFIAVGVAKAIMVNLFQPAVVGDGFLHGIVLAMGQAVVTGGDVWRLFIRPGGFPDILGLVATAILLLIVIYLEAVRVEIPISYARFSGYRARYPVKYLYVSVVPVIFASTIFANIFYIGSLVWRNFNPDGSNWFLNIIPGTYEVSQGRLIPTGGLAYYVTSPTIFQNVILDPIRALIYAGLMVGLAILFGIFWVEVGGLGPRKVAEQLISAGMQIPGFRRSPEVIANVVGKYIFTVAVLGAATVGLIASLGDFFNVYGGGTGILLLASIIHQYYQLLVKEKIEELHPGLARLLGRE